MSVVEGDGGADRGSGPAPTEDLLYGVIRRLWPLHRTIVRAVERELVGTGMTAGEHALLDALRKEGPRTVPQLARALGLDRQPVQRWVNHAAQLGLVVTAPNPAHRRSSLIELTIEGSEVMRGIQEFEAAELRRGLADLSADDVTTTLRVLDRLGEEFRHLADDSAVPPEEPGAPAGPEQPAGPEGPDGHDHPGSSRRGPAGPGDMERTERPGETEAPGRPAGRRTPRQ
ncbi:MarR family winged helix-turn-helix transcriptional regulator [Streptomyces celluloflavus]|uniref:MarR family winged helix-turn-helix transcriptional regulator n=1 Tax=Streptomyces celluloflavus TaxID=58344 RepID=A0ABW7RM73_9ACTN|nr:MarR family winged helix-turn-helix transcriptional regulator [Streptomyces celluloflavus]